MFEILGQVNGSVETGVAAGGVVVVALAAFKLVDRFHPKIGKEDRPDLSIRCEYDHQEIKAANEAFATAVRELLTTQSQLVSLLTTHSKLVMEQHGFFMQNQKELASILRDVEKNIRDRN